MKNVDAREFAKLYGKLLRCEKETKLLEKLYRVCSSDSAFSIALNKKMRNCQSTHGFSIWVLQTWHQAQRKENFLKQELEKKFYENCL